jgi:hydrogenase expression/formation protein HypC
VCLSTVGRVVALDGGDAIVDLSGVRRQAQAILVPDLVVGDLVLVGLGTVLGRVDPADHAVLDDLLTAASPVRTASTAPDVTSGSVQRGSQ